MLDENGGPRAISRRNRALRATTQFKETTQFKDVEITRSKSPCDRVDSAVSDDDNGLRWVDWRRHFVYIREKSGRKRQTSNSSPRARISKGIPRK